MGNRSDQGTQERAAEDTTGDRSARGDSGASRVSDNDRVRMVMSDSDPLNRLEISQATGLKGGQLDAAMGHHMLAKRIVVTIGRGQVLYQWVG